MAMIISHLSDYGQSKALKRAYEDIDAVLDEDRFKMCANRVIKQIRRRVPQAVPVFRCMERLQESPIRQLPEFNSNRSLPRAPFIPTKSDSPRTLIAECIDTNELIIFDEAPSTRRFKKDTKKPLRSIKERKYVFEKKSTASMTSKHTAIQCNKFSKAVFESKETVTDTGDVEHVSKRIKMQSGASTKVVHQSNNVQIKIKSSFQCSYKISFDG